MDREKQEEDGKELLKRQRILEEGKGDRTVRGKETTYRRRCSR